MATVYLHIGLPKTGTTSIQNLLWDNRTLLEKHSICYPDLGFRYPHVGYLRNAHFLISSCKTDPNNESEVLVGNDYQEAMHQLENLSAKFDKIFLADEALWHAKDNQPAFWKRLIEDLDKRNLSLRIIVYLRRQDDYTQSLYCQKIKAGVISLTFDEFLDSFMRSYPLDYYAYITKLSECVGRDNLILRLYDKSQFLGEEHNLFSDFLDIFGLSFKEGFKVQPSDPNASNASIDETQLELRRILNTLPRRDIDSVVLTQSFLDIMRFPSYEDNRITLFPPGKQGAFYERFADSNGQLAKEYFGREDGILFLGNTDKRLDEYHMDEKILLQDTILLYAKAVCWLEEKNNSLRQELKQLHSELAALRKDVHSEMRDVRENVILYRLKRKIRHLSDKKDSK